MTGHFVRQMSRGRVPAVLASTVVALTLLAACGGTTDSNKNANSAPVDSNPVCGTGDGKAASGTPIEVGGMVTASGGANLSQGTAGAKAYFECLNANGGINGHPVSYTIVDDALNPAKAAQGATTLVEDKKVVAVVGSTSYLECPVAGPIYAKANVFELEAAGGSAQCYTSANISSVAQSAPLTILSAAQVAKEQGGAKTISVIVPNIPGLGDASIEAVKRYAGANGVKVLKSVLYPPGVQDATSVVLSAAAPKPDAIVVGAVPADAAAIFKAAQGQNLKSRIKFTCAATCYSPGVPEALGSYWEKDLLIAHSFADFTASGPDMKLWRSVMAKYAPKVDGDNFTIGSFLAAKIFSDTLAKTKGDYSTTSVTDALKAVVDYKSDIICTPWYFGSGPVHVANHGFRVSTIANGSFAPKTDCAEATDPQLAPLLAAEKKFKLVS